MRFIAWLLVMLLTLVELAGCDANVKLGYFAKGKAAALSRTQDFRSLYDQQNFEKLYELGSPAMHAGVSRAIHGVSYGYHNPIWRQEIVQACCVLMLSK